MLAYVNEQYRGYTVKTPTPDSDWDAMCVVERGSLSLEFDDATAAREWIDKRLAHKTHCDKCGTPLTDNPNSQITGLCRDCWS